jgi:hypothetical protein
VQVNARCLEPFACPGAHHLREADQFLGPLTLVTKSREEGHDFRVGRGTGEQLPHHRAGFEAGQITSLFEFLDRLTNSHRADLPAARRPIAFSTGIAYTAPFCTRANPAL